MDKTRFALRLGIIAIFSAIILSGCDHGFLRGLIEDRVLPPRVKEFTVNAGVPYTGTQFVSLYSDVRDAVMMHFSSDAVTWTGWDIYIPVFTNWDVGVGDGTKVVYAEYMDNTSQITTASDTIILDTATSGLSDASLSGLTPSVGSLNPTFAPALMSYTLSLTSLDASVTMTVTTMFANYSTLDIQVNAGPWVKTNSGSAYGPIATPVGTTVINVRIVAMDMYTTQIYTVAAMRP